MLITKEEPMKKELLIGIAGAILTLMGAGYYTVQYQKYFAPSYPAIKGQVPDGMPQGSYKPGSTITLTQEEIAKHNSANDCWMIVQGSAYAVTGFLNIHPGGASAIAPYCGADATQAFLTQGGQGTHSAVADQQLAALLIGKVGAQAAPATIQQADKNAAAIPSSGEREDENERREEDD